MFKKSKRNFRSNRTEIHSEEEEENVSVQTDTFVSVSKPVSQVHKLKSETTATKLSFEDEEDGIEFKVKKSKESRRIVKELKKSKKEQENESVITIKKEEKSSEIFFNEEIRIKPLKKTEKNLSKYLTNKYASEEIKSEDEFGSYQIESDEEAKPVQENESDKLMVIFKNLKKIIIEFSSSV